METKKIFLHLTVLMSVMLLLCMLFFFSVGGSREIFADAGAPDIEYTVIYLDSADNSVLDTPNAATVLASSLPRPVHAPNEIKAGYTFAYWGINSETPLDRDAADRGILTTEFALQWADSNDIITLYAYWTEIQYTISVEYKGIEYGYATDPTGLTEINNKIAYDDTLDLTAANFKPTCSGHEFKGWFSTNDCIVGTEITTISQVTSNLTIYGLFERLQLYIIFDDSELGFEPIAFRSMADRAYDYMEYPGLLQDLEPKKEGYKFDGWYTSEDLSASSRVGKYYIFTANENVTLYAKWIANPSPIWWWIFGGFGILTIGGFLIWWLIVRRARPY